MSSGQGDRYRYFWIKVSSPEQRDTFSSQSLALLRDLQAVIDKLKQNLNSSASKRKFEAAVDELAFAYLILASNLSGIQNNMTRSSIHPPPLPCSPTLQLFPFPERESKDSGLQFSVVELPSGYSRQQSERWIKESRIGELWARTSLFLQLGQVASVPAYADDL